MRAPPNFPRASATSPAIVNLRKCGACWPALRAGVRAPGRPSGSFRIVGPSARWVVRKQVSFSKLRGQRRNVRWICGAGPEEGCGGEVRSFLTRSRDLADPVESSFRVYLGDCCFSGSAFCALRANPESFAAPGPNFLVLPEDGDKGGLFWPPMCRAKIPANSSQS